MIGLGYHDFKKRISGIYKFAFVFLASFIAVSATQAQDYQRKISWSAKPQTYTLPTGTSFSRPTFTNATHIEQYGMLPFYTEAFQLPAGEATAEILNAVYSAAGTIDNAALKFIEANASVKTEITYYQKRAGVYVSVLPFRKNVTTGTIEKLESFTIRLQVKPLLQRRSLHAYAASSVLASGSWYKIATTTDGIHKIDYNYIKTTLGIEPADFNFNTLAIFGNGGGMVPDRNSVPRADDLLENPTMVVDHNGNNKMDADDYLLFYGQMADAWTYNSGAQKFTHEKNLYSDKTFFFLTTDKGTNKRVATAATSGSPNQTINEFDERAYHDNDEYNLLESGKLWFGDKMTSFSNTQTFAFTFPNIITSVPVAVNSSIAANARYNSTTLMDINGQNVITHNIGGISPSDYPPGAIPNTSSATYNAGSGQINVTYTFNVSSDPSGTAACYINWFELQLKRALTLSGDAMSFRSIASMDAGNVSQFNLNNASGNTRVWNVSDIGNIQQMQATLNGSQLSFVTVTDTLKEFIAFNDNAAFGNPEYIGKVENQDLHATGQPDMIILSHDDFLSASNDLAEFHRVRDNITVSVIRVGQVYNEFGSGKPDISAIRDFVKMVYDRAGTDTSKLPRYLLLMGDGSYDPKGRISNSNNFIPTYQSSESFSQISTYVCDDFFGLLDANEGGDISSNQQLDIAIGRIPIGTEAEATEVVNKIKNYKQTAKACTGCAQVAGNNSWRNMLTFIADDLDNGGALFEDASDLLAEDTRGLYPSYNFEKIYLDAYKQESTPAGNRIPDVNTAIINRINAGTLIINWVGHGGETNWAHERIFNMSDIVQLQNQYLPLFVTATCDFSRYDVPERTAGEALITNGKGGGIASVTTVRLVYADANAALNTALFEYLFAMKDGKNLTLGEIMLLTKNNVNTDVVNTRKFTLLGDPALQLNYPRYNITTTAINNKPIALPQDTLKALALVTISGEVLDDNNQKLSSFNGTLYPLVYDKRSVLKTLGNDGNQIRNYNIFKNILFKGKASVVNGDFSFSFIVPKDINYQFGKGRISYYADNTEGIDAHGYNDDVIIGGSADTFNMDNAGPQMKIYMNDEKFVFGGITNTSPMLYVKLADSSGINTAGNGIGHDLSALLDNNQNMLVLNDYYESALDNFMQGEIKYPFSKLADGRHTLKIKAWDIYNNSSEGYTEFIVTSNAKLALNHVYNYPNPFTTRTNFMFEHTSPCEDLNVSVQIYTVSGKLVKSIVQPVRSVGYRVDDIAWDGLDDFGDPIGKGVYVYKVSVRDANGNSAHKFEKLVVLR